MTEEIINLMKKRRRNKNDKDKYKRIQNIIQRKIKIAK